MVEAHGNGPRSFPAPRTDRVTSLSEEVTVGWTKKAL